MPVARARLVLLWLAVSGVSPLAHGGEPAAKAEDSRAKKRKAEPLAPMAASDEEPAYTTTIRAPRPRSDRATPVRRVDEATLETSARSTLLERLSQEVPGLYVSAGRGGGLFGIGPGSSGGIRMRGLGGSPNTQVLILEDGVPDVMGLFGHPIPDAYLPAFVAHAEVVPGGDSVLFGSGAMAGVIALTTRHADRDGSETRLLTEGGSFGTVLGHAGNIGRAGAWDWLVSLRALSTDGHRDYAGGQQKDGLVKLRRTFDGGLTLEARHRFTLLEGFDPGTVARPYADHFYRAHRFSQSLALRHANAAGEGARLSGFALAYFNLGLHRLYDGFESQDTLAGLWLEETATLGRTLELRGGLDARRTGGFALNSVSAERFGAFARYALDPYAQATFEPHRKVALVAGGRAHWSDVYGATLLGKLGAEVRPIEGLRLQSRYVMNYREPTLVELYLPFPVANPMLRPERSETFDVSAKWRPARWASLSAAVYRTAASDYIRTLGAFPSLRRENVASLSFWGVEAAARVEGLGPFFLALSGSHAAISQYTAQNPSSKLDFTVGLAFARWRVALSGEWLGGLYQGDYGERPLPDPWFLDLRVERRWLGDRLRAFVTLRNLVNRSYAFIEGYVMPGFNASVGLGAVLR